MQKLLPGHFATVGGKSQRHMPGFLVKFRLEAPNTKEFFNCHALSFLDINNNTNKVEWKIFVEAALQDTHLLY